MRRAFIFAAILLMAVIATSKVIAAPQKGSAVLMGVVLGPDDEPVAHASVTYQSSGGNAPHAVYTDSRGHFTISKLRGDDYDLRASSKGVFSEWQKNVAVKSGTTKTVTLHLIYAKEMPKAYGATPAKR
jgi:Carboxypeptidase regulatory-like domain